MLRIFTLSILGLIFQATAYGQVPCPSLNTAEEIIECAILRHPEVSVSEAGVNQSIKLEKFARQYPNPEFDMRTTYGKSLGDNIVNTELNLGFVLQLGGKRKARIQQAWAEQAEANASLLRTKEDVYISTLSSLIRLRQLSIELEAMDHALEAFSNIQSLYRSYGKLSPEQQISLNIFQIAHGDYRARRTATVLEQQRYLRNIQFILGEPVVLKSSIYPKAMKDWPKLMVTEDLNGSGIKLAEADLKAAEADLKAAQGDSWPTLTVGPSIEQQTQGPFTTHTFGFNLSLPIPVFNVNQGGRAYANAGVMRSQKNLNAQKSKLLAEKEILIQQYNSIIEALKGMPSSEAIEKKHINAEGYFRRGLLSTSLMVEYHRQIVDYIVDQNQLELNAVENLWRVYALEGRIFPQTNTQRE